MLVVFFLLLGFMTQLCWGALGNIFQVQVQSDPLIVLFAYAVLFFPTMPRIFLCFCCGWLVDLHLGGFLGVHASVLLCLSFLAPWCQRNLRVCRKKAFPLFVFVMSLLVEIGAWVFALPFQELTMQSSLFFQLETAFYNTFWSLFLWPFFMVCSRWVDYEENERPLFLHG